MLTNDFNKNLTSGQLQENFTKQFGSKVNLEQYDREQLEDIRNKLRTKIFQQEEGSKMNDLLTNETYQKNKAMLQLLNTKIKEMLGEDLVKLRNKMTELSEAKKGVRAPRYHKRAKGSKGTEGGKGTIKPVGTYKKAKKDWDGDGKVESPKDEVWGSRMKAAAKKTKKTANKDQKMKETYNKNEKTVDEARPSSGLSSKQKSSVAKKAKKGADIGKPGKNFKKVAAKAAEKYGSKERGEKVAAAAMWKNIKRESQEKFRSNVRVVNENLKRLLREDEEGKAKAITTAGDIVNDYTSWMQRVGQYQTKSMIELADAIRADFGPVEAETFKQSVGPALAATLETLTQQREAISNAVAVLAGEDTVQNPMGQEPQVGPGSPSMAPDLEAGLDLAGPDELNPPSDEFAASDAAAGGAEVSGREMRESRFARKLAESHSIIAKLAK